MGKHKRNLFKKMYLNTRCAILKFYMSVNYGAENFNIAPESKCLCLAPHQDDETIGMGGTLAKYHDNFDCICLTDGSKGLKDAQRISGIKASESEAVSIRAKEFENAMNIAGIKQYKILDIKDRSLAQGYKQFSKINFQNYDYVFIPNIIDQHKDHKAVSFLLYKYLTENDVDKDFKICFYEVWSTLGMVNACIDIKEYIKTKEEMLIGYKSQTTHRSYTPAAIGLSAYRGLSKNLDYAEAYLILTQQEFVQLVEDIYPIIK